MASHMENAATHLAAAMTATPGSSEELFHTVATQIFTHAAETDPTTEETQ